MPKKPKKHKAKPRRSEIGREKAVKERIAAANQYRVTLRDTLIVPEAGSQTKMALVAAGSIIELMDMQQLFRDRTSPITRLANEILVRWGPRGKEALGWIASDTPLQPVKGPLFFVRSRDITALTPWDRLRYFIARADARQMRGQRWWLMPWLVANAADFDVEIKKAIRERGGIPDKKATDPDIHAAHLFRLINHLELSEMRTATKSSTKSSKKTPKIERTAKSAKAAKSAKTEKKAAKAAPSGKTVAVVSSKNHAVYERQREYDGHIIKRLTKDNPHREGSTQAKRWALLKKGMSIGEYASKGGSRGTLSQWLRTGAAKIVRGGGDASAE